MFSKKTVVLNGFLSSAEAVRSLLAQPSYPSNGIIFDRFSAYIALMLSRLFLPAQLRRPLTIHSDMSGFLSSGRLLMTMLWFAQLH